MKNIQLLTIAAFLLAGFVAVAESELDGKKAEKAPQFIVKKLDPKTQVVTSYRVNLDESLSRENLDKLSEKERNEKIEAFLKDATKPENKIAEEKVEAAEIAKSELDKDSSTSACRWRWRGCYSGGYYGYGFYNYYAGARHYYQPYWGYYGCGGYYSGYWGGQGWRPYGGPYYTVYSQGYAYGYGYGW